MGWDLFSLHPWLTASLLAAQSLVAPLEMKLVARLERKETLHSLFLS